MASDNQKLFGTLRPTGCQEERHLVVQISREDESDDSIPDCGPIIVVTQAEVHQEESRSSHQRSFEDIPNGSTEKDLVPETDHGDAQQNLVPNKDDASLITQPSRSGATTRSHRHHEQGESSQVGKRGQRKPSKKKNKSKLPKRLLKNTIK